MMDITLMSPSASVYNGRDEPLTMQVFGVGDIIVFDEAISFRLQDGMVSATRIEFARGQHAECRLHAPPMTNTPYWSKRIATCAILWYLASP
jgi:hypothetical protein